MRRKIEKFLAKKQGCDESNIRYTEDGRFDFMGDLEGVLNAVRGKDAGKGKNKGDRKSGKKPAKKGRKDDNKMPHMGMPMHYMPYGMPPPPNGYVPYPPHMPPDMMMSHPGNDNRMMYPPPYGMPEPPKSTPRETAAKANGNVPLAPKPTSDKAMPIFSPWKSATKGDSGMSPFIQMNITPGPSTSNKRDFRSACMSSSRKYMFDSPRPLINNLGISMGSPAVGGLDINGMTPLSNLKGTFSTPYNPDMFSEFSREDNFSLNKALFADEDGRPSAKKAPKRQTPKSKTPKQMRFSFGARDEVYTNPITDMHYNRVSISPLSCKKKDTTLNTTALTCDSTVADITMSSIKLKMPPQSASRTIQFADERDDIQAESATKIHRFMPSITQISTPRNGNVADSRDLGAPSPFDATLTPINSYDQSNWGYQLGFSPQATSMTPFKSPGMPLSAKKDHLGALAALSINNVLNTSTPNKVKASEKFESPVPKRQRTVVKSEVTGQD